MKNFAKLTCALFALSFTAPAFADELGPGKPKETQTTQTSTQSATTECSFVETVLGTCETEETVSE